MSKKTEIVVVGHPSESFFEHFPEIELINSHAGSQPLCSGLSVIRVLTQSTVGSKTIEATHVCLVQRENCQHPLKREPPFIDYRAGKRPN